MLTDEDFKPIVLTPKKKPGAKQSAPGVAPTVHKSTGTEIDIRKIENEDIRLSSSGSIKTEIQKKRVEMKLTQEQLDNLCAFARGTIQKYENGSIIAVSTAELSKINKVLKSNIKKPKQVKQ